MRTQRLAFFGKGGIGKSTLSANLSAFFAAGGLKVLHVGCDPKRDSTALLIDGRPETVAERAADLSRPPRTDELVRRGRLGVDCVEAGGPEPGVGCGGLGISRMFELFERSRLLEAGGYDVAAFDVLGDVVCGGFAAPLRRGFAEKVFIVVSEELMALYAANNIARAVRAYGPNGAALGGLIANLRDPSVDRARLERFAQLLGTTVLGYVPRDPALRRAEALRRTAAEAAPRSPAAAALRALSGRLLELEAASLPAPTPLADEEFARLAKRGFRGRPAPAARPGERPEAPPAAPVPGAGRPLIPPARRAAPREPGPAARPGQALDHGFALGLRLAANALGGAAPLAPPPGEEAEQAERLLRLHDWQAPALDLGSSRPPGDPEGGWLEGYARALEAAASRAELRAAVRRRGAVVLAGGLMTRNEEDQRADAAELRRLLAGLGLETAAVLPDGRRWEALERAGEAELVVALPYGLEAARTLARRTGADLVEPGLPLGLEGTRRWLEAVGEACGRRRQARAFASGELRRAAGRLRWILPHALLNRRFLLAADPHAAGALADFLEETGGRVEAAFTVGRAPHARPPGGRARLRQRPSFEALAAELEAALAGGLDAAVCPSDVAGLLGGRLPVVELGFPSWNSHALAPRPTLGFEGALALAQRLACAVLGARPRP